MCVVVHIIMPNVWRLTDLL